MSAWRLCVLVAASLVIHACTPADRGEEGKLPIEELLFDDDAAAAAFASNHRERESEISQCMAQLGFGYVELPSPQIGALAHTSPIPTEVAETVGYGLAQGLLEVDGDEESVQVRPSENETADALSDAGELARVEALYGRDGLGGCKAEAERRFPHRVVSPAWQEKLEDVMSDVESSDLYLLELDEWRSCMSAYGYVGVEPGDLFSALLGTRDEFRQQLGFGPPSADELTSIEQFRAEEVAAATAEAECSIPLYETRTDLYETAVAALSE